MSGHSKWATIKHKKAATDSKRGKLFTKLIKEVTVAARMGGGDASANPRLRLALDKARGANMPKDTVERAIKKGTGDIEGVNYEEITYEGYGPGGIAVMLTALTENRNRTVADVRHAFGKCGGNLGETGCVGFLFEHRGQIAVERQAIQDMDDLQMAAIEAGATDIDDADPDVLTIYTGPENFEAVRDLVQGRVGEVAFAEVGMVPKTTVEPDDRHARGMVRLIGMLEDNDDVQDVYHNADLPEEAFG